jgi:hypothetical protein
LFPKEKPISLREMPKFPEGTYVLKLLTIIGTSYLFLYRLVTYIKGIFLKRVKIL